MNNNIDHILVIDDDNRIRELLGKFLKDNGFFVTLSSDAINAKEKLKEFIFDLLIVDVMMPEETGVEFTQYLRKNNNNVPILMLTAMGEAEERILGLEAGADDYLPKPFEPRELLLRVKNILQRTKKQTTKDIWLGDFNFDMENSKLKKGTEIINLTTNEEMLLNILCQKRGEIISREEISKLCGGINERSIDVQITRLRSKIEKDSKKPLYLKTVRGKGYTIM